ncbi:hypothetical protein NLI96_g2842 [Meripilus lineatus]|uniref:Uncharacterized protein n=1 Tax=Meripilus lineatus TaxID=2056292 RepID=A0AAD5V7L1_9APHY|nr:hypothetical protein NLI96_g2842 [Physisporinus lineatus]
METLPPELHVRIFAYACMDDGAIGRSLSSVSRYIREVSSPFQWQSVSLVGHENMLTFAGLVRQTRTKRPIYHLFLSDGTPPFPRPDHVYGDSKHFHQSVELRDALRSILAFAAPTLDTLTFYSVATFLGGGASIAYLLSISYPRLTELTIRGRCTPVQLTSLSQSLGTFPHEMPSLRRLHLAIPCHGFAYGNLQEIHSFIRCVAPNVTHFRLSMLDMWGSKRVAEVLHAELAASGIVKPMLELPCLPGETSAIAIAQEVAWDVLLPKSLQLFVIQPSPTKNFYCSCCMEFRGDVDVMRVFEKLSEEADESRFLLFNRGSTACMGYGSNEAKQDWLDRMDDGTGCWKQRDEAIQEPDDDRLFSRSIPQSPPLSSSLPTKYERKSSFSTKIRKFMKKLKIF